MSRARAVCTALLAACALAAAARAQSGTGPRLPEVSADLGAEGPGRTISLGPGGDLQAALDAARPGDTITLDPRGIYPGPFALPRKPGNGWITVRSSAKLPPPGTRIGPAQAALLPKLIAAGGPAIRADPGAHQYRFVNLEVRPRAGAFVYALVEFGDGAMSTAQLPHHLVIAGCWLHGDPLVGGRRGIALNSGAAVVADSTVSDFKESGNDSQAIAGWSGPGPFSITNNYLEAAGENVLFGGGDPPGPDRIPSDIEVRGNFLSKPLSWKAGGAGYLGTTWTVKNLFELKAARRVRIEGNVFEHNWAQAQSGFAILFTVRNQDGGAPWSVVEDVTFAGNLVRDAGAGINVLGHDDRLGMPSGQARRIAIRDNHFERLGGPWGGNGTFLQLLEGTADVVVEHNTALQSGSVVVADGAPHQGFVFRRNLVLHNQYGIIGSGTGIGNTTLAAFFPGAVVEGNLFVGGAAASYPPRNSFVASLGAVFDGAGRSQPRAPFADVGARTPAPTALH